MNKAIDQMIVTFFRKEKATDITANCYNIINSSPNNVRLVFRIRKCMSIENKKLFFSWKKYLQHKKSVNIYCFRTMPRIYTVKTT